MSNKNRYEITSAETKSIGFDYQYYYFLLELLKLRAGQKLGLEVKDDIHIDLYDNSLVLLQLKHSIQTNSSGSIQNLTERDIDLWKTLHNWIQVIQDKIQGRGDLKSQLMFINKTTFILVSNKTSGTKNKLFTKMEELNEKRITTLQFKIYLKEILGKTLDSKNNKELRGYISELINLNNPLVNSFISKINFKLNEDDLISKIKTEIKGFLIPDERIDDVYNSLNSTLRDNIYYTVKEKNKIVISHEEFINKFRNCFGRMKKLPRREIEPIFPSDYKTQPFIKQLIEIGDVREIEKEQIIGYTKLRLLLYNNMKQWIHNGELTGPQKIAFDNICLTHWNNSFRSAHRKNRRMPLLSISDEDIIDAANTCLNDLRKVLLKIEDEELDIEISNGQFYQLADELKIGWHLDWENKYKNK